MLDEVIIFLEAFPIICIQELSPHRLLVGVEYNSSLIVIDTSNGETVNAVENNSASAGFNSFEKLFGNSNYVLIKDGLSLNILNG